MVGVLLVVIWVLGWWIVGLYTQDWLLVKTMWGWLGPFFVGLILGIEGR